MPHICPRCGKNTVGGMCLDCGIIEDTAPDKNITAEEIAQDDTPDEQPSALTDVKAPELASTNGEEFVPKTFSEPRPTNPNSASRTTSLRLMDPYYCQIDQTELAPKMKTCHPRLEMTRDCC